MLSRPFYRSIAVSPVEAWVVARAPIYSGKTANAKIVHSEENGLCDKMLLNMANNFRVTGMNQIESRVSSDSLYSSSFSKSRTASLLSVFPF